MRSFGWKVRDWGDVYRMRLASASGIITTVTNKKQKRGIPAVSRSGIPISDEREALESAAWKTWLMNIYGERGSGQTCNTPPTVEIPAFAVKT